MACAIQRASLETLIAAARRTLVVRPRFSQTLVRVLVGGLVGEGRPCTAWLILWWIDEWRRGVMADNCGACSLACSSNNVTPLCSGGVCSGPCLYGFSDCNNNKAIDGCESNTLSDSSNCGSCGSPCSTNHVTPSCTGGQCQGTCQTGWGNCDGDLRSNGCETDVSSSTTIITQASPENTIFIDSSALGWLDYTQMC